MTWQASEITDSGAWSASYEGAYVGGTQYPYTCPYGDVDRLSLFYGQKVTADEAFKFAAQPAVGSINYAAGEAQTPPWSEDINSIYTAPGGHTGEVILSLERIATDGTVTTWSVVMTVEAGVVTGISFKRPIKRPIKQSIKRSTLQ